MNSYSLEFTLHFVEAVKPQEIARNKEDPKSEHYSSCVPSQEAVGQSIHLQSIPSLLRGNGYNN